MELISLPHPKHNDVFNAKMSALLKFLPLIISSKSKNGIYSSNRIRNEIIHGHFPIQNLLKI